MRNFQFKYGLLILSGGFLAVTIYPLFIPDVLEVNAGFVLSSALTFCVSVLCVVAFARLRPSWKTVALNRMRIVVGLGKQEQEYTWLDVRSIALNRYFGFYNMWLKNGQQILFSAYGKTRLLTGDTSEMGMIIEKMKRDLAL